MKRRYNRDLLTNAPPSVVAEGTMRLLDRMQDMKPEVQIACAATVFLALTKRLGIEPQDAFVTVKNMLATKEGERNEFYAVEAYCREEL